ncbi:Nuclear actin-protein involved in chromatin remodeling [Malassezia cuniculi]|uniref:Nuclear actin-protein involved in chromatin remodeling n=1 Tax=Malassezia cuniculi TaxID=948313 RepID=A0AAF0EUF6_9BASI|nr:Nuclear actin-protein involved in chromatin remodeling [Malassezia cuniculi]
MSEAFRAALYLDEQQPVTPTRSLTGYRDSVHWSQRSPILIDNGSSELRAGFSTLDTPFAYDNIVSRFRDRKRNMNMVLCGNDCYVDSQSRASIKSAFDADVVCGFDTQEHMFDYTFRNLGIDASTIEHPILMTETLCNPQYCRGQMSELLFEAYNVPSICYGMDALFAAHANHIDHDGLVVSSGRATTLLVPIVGARGILDSAKRLSWGGSLGADYLLRLLQLKYPNFPQRITATQSATMMAELCYTSADYESEIVSFGDPARLAAADRVVQLPYTAPERHEKTQEELDRIAERKKAASQRLVEQTRLMREERAQQKENDLTYYEQLREYKQRESHEDYLRRIEAEGFDTEQEFEKVIKRLEQSVRGRDKDPEERKPPECPLLDVPDAELDEEGIKEKRRQRLLKNGYEARERARAEKEEQQRLEAAAAEAEEEEKKRDPAAWAAKLRKQHADTLERIRERKKLKDALPNRKSAAAQQRMKSITALASETNDTTSRRRKRGQDDDNFGADDNDWNEYRVINDTFDSEEEREELANLEALEAKLLGADTGFTEEDTYAAMQAQRMRLVNTFIRGEAPKWDPEDTAQFHQVHLNVERIRVPEVSWQPSIAGVDQAGVGELSAHVLRAFDEATRLRMVKNVLVTGRYSQIRGFDTRLESTLRSMLPPGTQLSVRRANNPRFDPWFGMQRWVSENPEAFRAASVTRAEYAEKGSAWFKEHSFSACWQA